jgi:hypothetical protein
MYVGVDFFFFSAPRATAPASLKVYAHVRVCVRTCGSWLLLKPHLFFVLKRVFCPRRVFVCFVFSYLGPAVVKAGRREHRADLLYYSQHPPVLAIYSGVSRR